MLQISNQLTKTQKICFSDGKKHKLQVRKSNMGMKPHYVRKTLVSIVYLKDDSFFWPMQAHSELSEGVRGVWEWDKVTLCEKGSLKQFLQCWNCHLRPALVNVGHCVIRSFKCSLHFLQGLYAVKRHKTHRRPPSLETDDIHSFKSVNKWWEDTVMLVLGHFFLQTLRLSEFFFPQIFLQWGSILMAALFLCVVNPRLSSELLKTLQASQNKEKKNPQLQSQNSTINFGFKNVRSKTRRNLTKSYTLQLLPISFLTLHTDLSKPL